MPEPGLADLIGLETAPRSVDYGWKDVVLYALGVGVPVEDLEYLYEGASGGLQVLPGYCVIPEYEAMVDLEGRFDQSRMLHGEQLIRMFRPIPPEGPLVVTGKVVNIFDKGKAAVIHSSATGSTASGEKVFETLKVGFYRGGGGFGGDPGPRAEVLDPPPGVRPDLDITYRIPRDRLPCTVSAATTTPCTSTRSSPGRPGSRGRSCMVCARTASRCERSSRGCATARWVASASSRPASRMSCFRARNSPPGVGRRTVVP